MSIQQPAFSSTYSSLLATAKSSNHRSPKEEAILVADSLADIFYSREYGGALNIKDPLLWLFRSRVSNCLQVACFQDLNFFPKMAISLGTTGIPPLRDLFSVFLKFSSPHATSTSAPPSMDYAKFPWIKHPMLFHPEASSYCLNRAFMLSLKENNPQILFELMSYLAKQPNLDQSSPLIYKCLTAAISLLKYDSEWNDHFQLFKSTTLDFIEGSEYPLSPGEDYRIGVRNFIYTMEMILELNTFSTIQSYAIPVELRTDLGVCDFLLSQAGCFSQELLLTPHLSPSIKRTINSSLHRHLRRLLETDIELARMKNNFFNSDSLKYYHDVLTGKKANDISLMATPNKQGEMIPPVEELSYSIETSIYPEFAAEHRDVYENLIPRFEEILTYFSRKSTQAKNDLKSIKEMALFFRFGNMPRLEEQLQLAKANPEKIDSTLSREIDLFIQEKKKHSIALPIISYLRGEGKKLADPHSKALMQKLEEKFTVFSDMLEILLRPRLEMAKQSLPHLFPHPAPATKMPARSRSLHQRPRTSPSIVSQTSSSSSSFTSSSSSLVSSSSSFTSSSSSGAPFLSFPSQAQVCRSHIQKWSEGLCQGRQDLTATALKNASRHFDDLLSSMRRLQNNSIKNPLTQKQLFAFVNDCVRHCTLGVEQTLSALDRDSNASPIESQTKSLLTHDLFLLLQNCKMGNGDLSPKVRKWIGKEINGGEILIRDVNRFTERKTALQDLLSANYSFAMGEEGSSASQVLDALSTYLDPLGEFLDSIQDRFMPVKEFNPVELEESVSQLCHTFCDRMTSTSIIPVEGPSKLAELYAHLDMFDATARSSEISSRIDNIRNNLLAHLEVEMQSNTDLEPIEAPLHLANVLMLNQIIAEEILLDAMSIQQIPPSFEEATEHNLTAHIEKLGIRSIFTSEELDFLNHGKASRQLIRYPESRATKATVQAVVKRGRGQRRGKGSPSIPHKSRLDVMQDMLNWAQALSAKQSAAVDLRGFRSADNTEAKKLSELKKFALKDISLLTSIIGKILKSTLST